jgi:hypothetical protein
MLLPDLWPCRQHSSFQADSATTFPADFFNPQLSLMTRMKSASAHAAGTESNPALAP